MKDEVETLVIGAGLIGSSVAMHLAQLGMSGIRVIDFDLEGSLSSSELNAGGVRATWAQPINISTSKLSIEYYAKHAQEIGFRECGYLWLYPQEKVSAAEKARGTQKEMGWPVEVWDLSQLKQRIPFIDKTEGIGAAYFSPKDGLLNPNLLKLHYRAEAKKRGVQFDDRTLLRRVEYGTFENSVVVRADRYSAQLSETDKEEVLGGTGSGEFGRGAEPVEYRARNVVNCAGAWASAVAEILGYPCPAYPVRRQVSIFDCRAVDLTPYGMIVDSSGVYFHPEATNGLAGYADPSEKPGVNFEYEGEHFFTDVIWPALYERSSGFEELKHLTGWAGLYEVSPDASAILGKVGLGEAGEYGRVYEAHSFSGHGAMHSYAAGLALAERIHWGKYQTLDLGPLSGTRFTDSNSSLQEGLVI